MVKTKKKINTRMSYDKRKAMVLAFLNGKVNVRTSRIARNIGLSSGRTAKILNTMSEEGLVAKNAKHSRDKNTSWRLLEKTSTSKPSKPKTVIVFDTMLNEIKKLKDEAMQAKELKIENEKLRDQILANQEAIAVLSKSRDRLANELTQIQELFR